MDRIKSLLKSLLQSSLLLPLLILVIVITLASQNLLPNQEGFHVNPYNNWDPRIGAGTAVMYTSGENKNNGTPYIYPGPWNIPTVYQENPIKVCGGLY